MTPFARRLLTWFERSGRAHLPWRRDRAPYRIVVSEFMLQQTQVDRAVPYFEAFVARWPAFADLARAPQADVVRAWAGLGYNSRAVRLHGLARAVVERYAGTLPRDDAALRALPGIGPYTARAVGAFAFDADVVANDTNVRRIVHRSQLGLEWPPLASETKLDEMAIALLPKGKSFAFNSALMDLGATICTARAPKCLLCPVAGVCAAAPVDAASLARRASEHPRPRGTQERLPFERTTRFVRGRVVDRLRALEGSAAMSLLDLEASLEADLRLHDAATFEAIVAGLVRDGIVRRDEAGIRLA